MTTTYTIATLKSTGMLIACVPDSADIQAAIAACEAQIGDAFDRDDIAIEEGLILTDDEDDGDVRYRGSVMGTLSDENGRAFEFAVRRAPGRPAELAGGKRVNVYLDAGSLDTASRLGGGNVSEGIRLALHAASSK